MYDQSKMRFSLLSLVNVYFILVYQLITFRFNFVKKHTSYLCSFFCQYDKINKIKCWMYYFQQELMDHLRSVYGPILDLQNLEETFLTRATQEYEARSKDKKLLNIHLSSRPDLPESNDAETNERQAAFSKYLNTLSIQLRLLSRTYQVTYYFCRVVFRYPSVQQILE